MSHVKTRFAPSPTGYLHIGGLRTALFAYLFAKKQGGTFVLRIEDTDQTRLVEGATENIIDTLTWAGITIDEGVTKNDAGDLVQVGECGPYIQSQRLDIYKQHAQQLLESGHAYYAFDTPEELEKMREVQQANKQRTIYDRNQMRNSETLSNEEVTSLLEANTPYVIRLKVPAGEVVEITDLVRGTVSVASSEVDDQVLLKADGFPTYHLAAVVDDHHMGITHIIRGEEWLPSTPKHVLLYKAFGWDIPTYAHLSLLVNEQKQKLSKRHGDVAVEDFINNGYLKEALLNFVAFLGWNPGTEQELFSMDELQQAFDMTQVGKAAAVFNREKLTWYQKQYQMSLPLNDITARALPFFDKAGIDITNTDTLALAIDLERSRVDKLSDLPEAVAFFFASELSYDKEILAWRKSTLEDAKEKLDAVLELCRNVENWDLPTLETTIKQWITDNGHGAGDVLWPLRVSLSGKEKSPGPFEIAAILGKEKTCKRIETAIDLLTK